MAPLTTGMLSNLERAIDQIPNQDCPFRNQSWNQLKHRARERHLFRKLVAKLAGEEKDDQVAFMINQSRRVSRTTYVKAVLESIPKQPDYDSLEKKNRQTHAHIHRLIDQILRIAAGSENIQSQKKIFENRWEYMHKQAYVPTTMSIKTIQKMTDAKFGSRDERINFYLSQARRINKKAFLHKALESIPAPPEYSSLN